jgi:hypothetical protein
MPRGREGLPGQSVVIVVARKRRHRCGQRRQVAGQPVVGHGLGILREVSGDEHEGRIRIALPDVREHGLQLGVTVWITRSDGSRHPSEVGVADLDQGVFGLCVRHVLFSPRRGGFGRSGVRVIR